MNSNSSLSLGFEFLDIEIIDHKKESGSSNEKWNCDMCSLFFLSKDRLLEHKNKHAAALEEAYKCKYCNKTLSIKEESKESYANQKCNTCEYKCSKCSLRFQRYSSFVNHEKSHSLLKKKKSISIKKKHVRGSEPPNNNVPKKHYTDKIPTVLQKNSKRKRINDEHKISAVSPKKRRTLPGALLNEKSKPLDTKDTLQKNNATTELITCSTTEEKTLGENKKNNKASLVTDPVNTSSHDNIVNYKPFSCHICGENFASGDHLLVHIQTHGENVSKGFKCKHCSEEFADIYKMQYHLAICPLAEDETTFVKNIPPKLHITPSSGMPRKQGRPKKIKHEPTNDDMDYCPTSSISTRGSLKKKSRNDENSEPIKKLPKILNSSSPKYSTRSRRNTAFKPDENNVTLSNEFVDSACSIMSDDEIGGQEDPLNVSVGYIDKENVTVALNDSYDSVNDDKPKVHSCPFPRCGIKFTREKALLCHMRNHNDDFEDSYKCHKCDIPFDDIHSLRSHLNECKDIKEENEDNVSEPEYKDDFTSPDKSFLKKRKDFTCNICGQVYPSQEKMKRCLHNNVNHSEKALSCRLCGKKFDDENILRKHFRSTHSKNLPFQCTICHVQFDTKAAESEHLTTHLDSEHFECIICSLNLPTYKDLYFHYKQDHVTKQQNICKICNKIFPNAKQLQNHECNDEAGYRQRCIFCHKSFCSTASLNSHVKRHTNKKIFKCSICYRAFFDTGDLMKHMLFHATVMTGKRHFKCCLCFVTYKNKPLLAVHIKNSHIKKDSVQLKCPICGTMLEDDKKMSSHLMSHSMSISKNNMSELELKWMEQTRQKHSESSINSKKGRPRKLYSDVNTLSTKTSQNQYSTVNGKALSKTKQPTSSEGNNMKRQEVSQLCSDSTSASTRLLVKLNKIDTKSKVGSRKYITRRSNLKINYKDFFDSSDEISVNSNEEQSEKSYDKMKSTEDQIETNNTDSKIRCLKINTQEVDLQPNNNIKSSKCNSIAFSANSKNLRVKSNLLKSPRLNESLFKNETGSKQRPMSFIKITSSYNNVKTNLKDSTLTQRPQKTSLGKASSHISSSPFIQKGQLSENVPSSQNDRKQTYLPYSGNIRIKEEKPEMSHTNNKDDYSNSAKEVLNKSFGGHVKLEEENEEPVPKQFFTKIKEEEPECFIKEKKYYEPSLGLTKYSCTTCLLTFSTQTELFHHNTVHIL